MQAPVAIQREKVMGRCNMISAKNNPIRIAAATV
jgi:hypothetical protein